MRDPCKWEIEEFAKLVNMIDFLKEELRPFAAIAKEAVRRGIIREDQVQRFYYCFSGCTPVFGMFEGVFVPYDQSPTGRDRWEWKLRHNTTRQSFMKEINGYVKTNFKTPL